MRKYLALARAELLDAIQEKGEVLVWMLISVIPVFVMASVWLANSHQVKSLNLSQLVTYYVVVTALGWVTEFWFDEHLHNEIRTGEFSRFLLKPLRFPQAFIFQNLGRKLFSITTFLIPTITLVTVMFKRYLIAPTASSLSIFIIAMIISYGIRYTLSTLAASGGFWWEQAGALVHLRWMMEILAGGYMLPISLYPDWLTFIPKSLPFQYIYYIPVSIFTGAISIGDTYKYLFFGSFWLIVLLILSEWVWRLGVKRYSGVGG